MSNRQEEEFYRQKYLKYKAKYLEAKNEVEGGKPIGLNGSKTCEEIIPDKNAKGEVSTNEMFKTKLNCDSSLNCKWDDSGKKCETKTCNDHDNLMCTKTKGCTTDKFEGTPAQTAHPNQKTGINCREKFCEDYEYQLTCPTGTVLGNRKCVWGKNPVTNQKQCMTPK